MSQTNQIVFQANGSPKPAKPERQGRGKANSGSNARHQPSRIRRYRDILLDLYNFTYMTSAHLQHHHRTVKEVWRLRATNRTLSRMLAWGLVRRIELPTYRSLREGPAPYLYTLDRSGARLVAEELGIPLAMMDWRPRPSEQNLWFMAHTLAIVDFALTLRQACEQHQYEMSWVGESQLRRDSERVKVPTGDHGTETVAFIPDGYCVMVNNEGRSSRIMLELDRGSVTIRAHSPLQRRAWIRRMKGYAYGLENGLFAQRYGFRSSMRVAVVASSPTRLQNLLAATEEAVENHQDSFWFSTVEEITPETVLTEPIWAVAGRGDKRYSLV